MDAKSIMSSDDARGVYRNNFVVETHGRDEEAAMQAILDLINDRFGEEQ